MSTESAVPEEQVTPETHEESQFLAVRQSYSGPLPSPDHLAGFDKVRPGLADTIISMATGEQDHRHRIEFMAALSFSAGPLLAFILGVHSHADSLLKWCRLASSFLSSHWFHACCSVRLVTEKRLTGIILIPPSSSDLLIY